MEDKRTSVAVFNDSEYVYIGLVTADRDLQRLITRAGVTWWFDREGGDKKTFGVHYPIFSRPPAPQEGEPGEGEAPPEDARGEDRRSDSGEMDVYTSGEEHPVRMTAAATAGDGRRPGGGGVPGGRRGGGGGRGERPQGRPDTETRPDPLKSWMKVQLAAHN